MKKLTNSKKLLETAEQSKVKEIFMVSERSIKANAQCVAVFDADGTLIDRVEGPSWNAGITALPRAAQDRIVNRIKLLADSWDTFEQQYLSASSLYEFALAEIDLEVVAKKVRLREGVADLFRYLHSNDIPVKIISHGPKDILEELMAHHGLEFVEVHANIMPSECDSSIIPAYESIDSMRNDDKSFLEYVKTIHVVPNTKGKILRSSLSKNSVPISIGDSLGDLDLFETTKESGGISILNIDRDKGHMSINQEALEKLLPSLNYITSNPEDYSFEPAGELIRKLIQ